MKTIYMPTGFDHEVWRDSPKAWLPELLKEGAISEAGYAEFLVADILGTFDVEIGEDGKIDVATPKGANFVTLMVDGDVADQGRSVAEIEGRFPSDWLDDFPMDAAITFWNHHEKARAINVLEEGRPTVLFRRLPNGKDLPLPAYKSDGAAGIDLAAAETCSIGPGEVAMVPTGFAIEIPPGLEGQVRGRSSLGVIGITIANGVGTIDSDYRGEVLAVLINHSGSIITIGRGERIAQLVIAPVARAVVAEVDELSPSIRGEGGFGSTGR